MLQFRLVDPEPMLFHNEALVRDGKIVSIVTSGNYGHHLGGIHRPGLRAGAGRRDRGRVLGSRYEIEIAGTRVARRSSSSRCTTPSERKDAELSDAALEARPTGRARGRAGQAVGGARRAARAPLAEDLRPVRPGLAGGRYSPLRRRRSGAHPRGRAGRAGDHRPCRGPESGIEAMTAAGAELAMTAALRFPRALVEDMLADRARDLPLHGRTRATTSS